MRELTDQVLWVTGASRGIGAAIARAAAAAGMRLVLLGRSEATLQPLADELDPSRARVLALRADVTDPASLRAALERTLAHFGALDAVVANAGVSRKGSIFELSEGDWRTVIETNLSGVFFTARTTVAALAERGGMFITIGSLAGAHAFAGGAAYNASKFGLVGLSEALMLDLRGVGVRVCSVMPGSTATSFSSQPERDSSWKLRPEDVAEAVLYALRSDPRALPSRIELRPARTAAGPAVGR